MQYKISRSALKREEADAASMRLEDMFPVHDLKEGECLEISASYYLKARYCKNRLRNQGILLHLRRKKGVLYIHRFEQP